MIREKKRKDLEQNQKSSNHSPVDLGDEQNVMNREEKSMSLDHEYESYEDNREKEKMKRESSLQSRKMIRKYSTD